MKNRLIQENIKNDLSNYTRVHNICKELNVDTDLFVPHMSYSLILELLKDSEQFEQQAIKEINIYKERFNK